MSGPIPTPVASTALERERVRIAEILAGHPQWMIDACRTVADARDLRARESGRAAAAATGFFRELGAGDDGSGLDPRLDSDQPRPTLPIVPNERDPLAKAYSDPVNSNLPTIVTLSTVQPTKIDWLWRQWIARAMLSLLDGNPGLGKSTTLLDLAARITTGRPMPLETERREPADVILLTAEDHLAATIRPRLDAAGADVSRIHAITAMPVDGDPDAPPMLTSEHIARLELAIVKHSALLVVVDPLMAYLDKETDSKSDQDIRRVLRLLAAVAERTGAAIVVVRHLRKSGGPALYRGGGSIGIIGAARSAMLVAEDPEDRNVRIIAVSKSNLAAFPPALRWRLVDADGVGRVEWLGVADGVTADDLAAVSDNIKASDDDADPIDAAADALRELLADGWMPTKEAERDVKAITGASARTIERARAKLGVESRKFGSIWMLRLKSATAPLTLGGDGGVDLSPQATARTHSENTPNSTPPLQLRHTPNGDDLAELKPSGDWLADAIAEDMARGEDGDL